MHRFLISIIATMSLAVVGAGCQSKASGDSNGAMKMSTAPACCGDACKKMAADCCTTDDKGKVTCSMGGSCCIKNDKMKM